LGGKTRDVIILAVLGFALIFVAWQAFHQDDAVNVSGQVTETEAKLLRLLSEIDGVGDADVMVYEGKNGVESVVVVCEGARNLQVSVHIREAVAAALGTEQKAVKIYLKKE
jgi:hypothetical protein